MGLSQFFNLNESFILHNRLNYFNSSQLHKYSFALQIDHRYQKVLDSKRAAICI
jgi:hypothetical protein